MAQGSSNNVAVWFEIPTQDFARAKRFYERVFAVKLIDEQMGPMRLGVFPHADEVVSGCIIFGEGYRPARDGNVVYLDGGEDLAGPLSRVEAAGGQVLVGKTLINDEIGYFAHVLDTEGNRVGLHSRH
jgi:predicted enzyme related to lactoylglutathione lyase